MSSSFRHNQNSECFQLVRCDASGSDQRGGSMTSYFLPVTFRSLGQADRWTEPQMYTDSHSRPFKQILLSPTNDLFLPSSIHISILHRRSCVWLYMSGSEGKRGRQAQDWRSRSSGDICLFKCHVHIFKTFWMNLDQTFEHSNYASPAPLLFSH